MTSDLYEKSFFSSATLSLTPAEAIIYEHNVANFFCSANEKITYIEWMLNGTNLRDMKVDNPKASMQDTFGTLIFSGFSARYNQTAIKCTVWIASNNEMFTSEEAIIRVQGNTVCAIKYLKEELGYFRYINFNLSSMSMLLQSMMNIPNFFSLQLHKSFNKCKVTE